MKLQPSSPAPDVVMEAAAESLDSSAPSTLLEHIAEHTAAGRDRRVELASGRVIEARPGAAPGEDHITVRGLSGEVELEVRMTEHGPVLRFRAAGIELASAGDVRVECDRFEVQAKSGIAQHSGGSLELVAAGDAAVRAGGKLAVTSRSARLEAERGSVEIEANDDVRLLAERIKLNC